jgi:hypothetical protein
MAYQEKLTVTGIAFCDTCLRGKTFQTTIEIGETIDVSEIQDLFDQMPRLVEREGWVKDSGFIYCPECKRKEKLM